MAMVGGFLGGGVEMVSAGQGQLCLQWLTPDRQNLAGAVFTVTGTGSTSGQYSVNGRDDGRAELIVPVGEYDVSVSHQGDYSSDGPQHIIVESTQSYLVYFGVQLKTVSSVMFTGALLEGINSYSIRDESGNIYYSGEEWYQNMQFLLQNGDYILKLTSVQSVDIPFSIQATGVTIVDLRPYSCKVSISYGFVPHGTKVTAEGVTYTEPSEFWILKDSATHRFSFSLTAYANGKNVVTIPDISVTANQTDISISPVASGVFTVIDSSTTIHIIQGKFRVLTVGGGGGGGGGYYHTDRDDVSGGGGGGSGQISDQILSISDGDYPVTIGSGGTTSSSSRGGSGGATSLGSLISSSGGNGGGRGVTGSGGSGMAGGGGGACNNRWGGTTYSAGSGGNATLGGGGGGGSVEDGNVGSGGSAGTHGGRGGVGGGSGNSGDSNTSDSFYYNGGSSKTGISGGVEGGGGGGGGYGASGGNGGESFTSRTRKGGGGGGGGARGGDGGMGGMDSGSYKKTGYTGKGYGAGGGGQGIENSYGDSACGGGGGGGYGSKTNTNDSRGVSGCVVIQWMSRD